MKIGSIQDVEIVQRPYGVMKMLAGGKKIKTKNLDVRILEIGTNNCTSKHYHIRSESLFYILQGSIELEIVGNILTLKKGDIILIEPGEFHLLRNRGANKCIVLEVMSPPFTKKDIFYAEDTPFR
jgi:mannose-6-phosphate isomerase-like protein (cupin superfamily)